MASIRSRLEREITGYGRAGGKMSQLDRQSKDIKSVIDFTALNSVPGQISDVGSFLNFEPPLLEAIGRLRRALQAVEDEKVPKVYTPQRYVMLLIYLVVNSLIKHPKISPEARDALNIQVLCARAMASYEEIKSAAEILYKRERDDIDPVLDDLRDRFQADPSIFYKVGNNEDGA